MANYQKKPNNTVKLNGKKQGVIAIVEKNMIFAVVKSGVLINTTLKRCEPLLPN